MIENNTYVILIYGN